jgi:hypothetical protein
MTCTRDRQSTQERARSSFRKKGKVGGERASRLDADTKPVAALLSRALVRSNLRANHWATEHGGLVLPVPNTAGLPLGL